MSKSERIQKRVQRAADLLRAGELVQAAASLIEVLRSDSKNADAWYLLGLIRYRERKFGEAAECFASAVKKDPRHANAHNELGLAWQALGRPGDALASFQHAIAADGAHALAHYNRGCMLQAMNRHEEAVASFQRAQQLAPHDPDVSNNLGNSLQALARHAEAVASYDRALALRPQYAEALNNRGNALQAQNLHQEALASYQQAIAVRGTDYADAWCNAAVARLRLGDFEAGWRDYEWRWAREDRVGEKRAFAKPLWMGSDDIFGKTILLHAEQGYGDTIQFVRFAADVAKRGARVILEVQPALVSLMTGLAGVETVLARGDNLPDFDQHCPLLSLPLALGTKMREFSNRGIVGCTYLTAPAQARNKWQGRPDPSQSPSVGLVWSGRREHVNDNNRSLAFARLLPLFAVPGLRWFSLQTEKRDGDAQLLAQNPEIADYGDAITDFADTAALIEKMDLVIAVDTAVVHLAGAMGKPVWIMLPFCADWRWLVEREDSPWYPTARLFRQREIGDWDAVIGRLAAALRAAEWRDRVEKPG